MPDRRKRRSSSGRAYLPRPGARSPMPTFFPRSLLHVPLVRMVGVVRWDHRPDAGAFDERPAVPRLEVMIAVAQPVEIVELGLVTLGPVVAMIELETGSPAAALSRADRL